MGVLKKKNRAEITLFESKIKAKIYLKCKCLSSYVPDISNDLEHFSQTQVPSS